MSIIIGLNNLEYANDFQVSLGAIIPPHLACLYGNQWPDYQFGYEKGTGLRSIMVTGAKQNAYSEKK